MAIAFIMLLLLTAVLLAWRGKRTVSISIYIISLLCSIAVFIYHTHDVIGLSL